MKTLIFVLIVISFIQSTIILLDLVLVILICRSYIKSDKANLILAFAFGLFIGFLNLTSMGLVSLIYLILVAVSETLSKSRLAGNPFLIIPLTFLLLGIYHFVLSLLFHEPVRLPPRVLLETLVSLPTLYLVRLWEERFIVRKEIKLRI